MILGIVYFVLSAVIIYQVFTILRLSDKCEDLQRDSNAWFQDYCRLSDDNRKLVSENVRLISEKEKLEQIIENVKNTMSF